MTNIVLAARVLLALAPMPAAAGPGTDPVLRAELESVARSRVYFGHQSVGYNIVQGLADLSAEAGVPLRIVEVADSLAAAPEAFLHGRVDENGNPLRKLESFRRVVSTATGPGIDVALLKFCYVDFDDRTDAVALFARYQATLAELRAIAPGTTFVHVTVPLTTVQGGIKATVKKLLGKKPYGASENLRREEYNALLRAAYGGREPVFDLAALESTRPDGSRETFEHGGRQVPALVPGYTDDGGHLNGPAAERVARELVALLARVPVAERAGR